VEPHNVSNYLRGKQNYWHNHPMNIFKYFPKKRGRGLFHSAEDGGGKNMIRLKKDARCSTEDLDTKGKPWKRQFQEKGGGN